MAFPASITYAVSTAISTLGNLFLAKFNQNISSIIHQENQLFQREAQLNQARLAVIQQIKNQEFQERLEVSRQEIQINQIKLALIQQKQNSDLQLELAQENQQFQTRIEQFRQLINLKINENSLNFQKWQFETQKKIQLESLNLNQKFQRELNFIQHQNILEKIRLDNSPIGVFAKELLEPPFIDGLMPLQVLLSAPELDYDVNKDSSSKIKIESFLAEKIRRFLRQGYDLNSKKHPTELIDKGWSTKKYGGSSALKTLYNQLKSIPILILESEFVDDKINLRYYFWDGKQTTLEENSLISLEPVLNFLVEFTKERARQWRKKKAELKEKGWDEVEIKSFAKETDEENLILLEREEATLAKAAKDKIDPTSLISNYRKQYRWTSEDRESFYDYLVILHCLTIAMTADILAFQRSCFTIPLLPKLLPNLLKKLDDNAETNDSIARPILEFYSQFYQSLEKNILYANLVAEIVLDLAFSFAESSYISFALREVCYSVSLWLKLHKIESDKIFDLNNDADCELLKSIIYQEDEVYLTKLQQFVNKIDKVETASDLAQIKSLLAGWQNLKRWSKIPNLSELESTESEPPKEEKPSQPDLPGEKFSFEIVTVNSSGKIINRQTKTNRQQVFQLGKEVELEMVYIPAGTFMMGALKDEEGSQDSERPQHQVTIKAFWMAKYPITQAQYRAIANKNPSRFEGDNNPVENVSYDDAIAFCNQLSAKLKKQFKLPSEAQWEYACRAGTTTPFYFGETITGNLANYDTSNAYANESLRVCRKKTTPVGTFKPNAFGLYDTHGNIWEWCKDNWHNNYDGAPTDGSAWIKQSSNIYVLRGGAWYFNPNVCRSAFRLRFAHNLISFNLGFRCIAVDIL